MMKTKHVPVPVPVPVKARMLLSAVVVVGAYLIPYTALGDGATSSQVPSSQQEQKASSEVQTNSQKSSTTEFAIGDGNPFSMKDLAISIVPPQGWEVVTNSGGLTMVIQEPKPQFTSKENESEVIFQRNITVAYISEASPIDETRATELTKQLNERFGKNPLVTNFQVLDHQFIDYHGKKDALLIYSSLMIGQYPMTQMHILVSGQDKQLLMTYTDLEKRFTADKATMQSAWNSMLSVVVIGDSPSRYGTLIAYGGGTLALILFLGFMSFLRRRSLNKMLAEEDDIVDSGSKSNSVTSEELDSESESYHDEWQEDIKDENRHLADVSATGDRSLAPFESDHHRLVSACLPTLSVHSLHSTF